MASGKRQRKPTRKGPSASRGGESVKPEAEKGERSARLHEELMEGIAALDTREGWKALLRIKSRVHHHSFRNLILIHSQKPDATIVAGRSAWIKKFKRIPKKGTAIYYFAPHTYKEMERNPQTGKDEEVSRTGFHVTWGFDISDTVPLDPNAPEIPVYEDVKLTGQAPAALWDGLVGVLAEKGYSVSRTRIGGGVKGDSSPTGKVRIDTMGSPMEQLAVLFHETAHVLNGHMEDIDEYRPHRGRFEVEAESVAWIAMKQCGLDVDDWSFPYVDGWAKGDLELLERTAAKVCKVADELVNALAPELGIDPLEPEIGERVTPAL